MLPLEKCLTQTFVLLYICLGWSSNTTWSIKTIQTYQRLGRTHKKYREIWWWAYVASSSPVSDLAWQKIGYWNSVFLCFGWFSHDHNFFCFSGLFLVGGKGYKDIVLQVFTLNSDCMLSSLLNKLQNSWRKWEFMIWWKRGKEH